MKIPGLGGWGEDPLWGRFYAWMVDTPVPGGLLWRAGLGSDLRRLHRAAAEIGELAPGSRVLDVPCGGGVALRGVHPGQGLGYTACDLAPDMLERTRRRAQALHVDDQVEYAVADVAALPFDDGAYDLVVSLTGLHCFPDPRAALVEMMRVLTPGGALTGSALLNGTGVIYQPLRTVGRVAGLVGPACTAEEIRTWLVAEGASDVRVEVEGALGYFHAVKA